MSSLLLVLRDHGLAVVFINVLVEQMGLPVPAVPTLIVAGSLAAGGHPTFGELFLSSIVACLLADCGWYLIGRRYGIRVLKTLCRISLEPDSCVSQTQSRFERWGVNSIVFAKFIPGLSIIAPPLAGAMRLGWPRFLLLSTAGAALWAGIALGAGMLFETQVAGLLGKLSEIGGAAGALILAALAAYIAYKWWDRAQFYESLRMARITVDELYDLIQAGADPVVVDVRSATALALEPQSIPGAVHVPIENVAAAVEKLPRDREIIVYCTCPSEASAARVARVLMNHGFKRVRPLHGGLDAWIAAGYDLGAIAGAVAPTGSSGT